MEVRFELADLRDPQQLAAVIDMIDHYASQPTGRREALPPEVKYRLFQELPKQQHARVLIAWNHDRPVGVAVCFLGFSTFRAKPVLNIHDLAVHAEFQGQGIGRKMLEAVKALAENEDCGAMTLEVRIDNTRARRLYDSFGFSKLMDPIATDAELFGRFALD